MFHIQFLVTPSDEGLWRQRERRWLLPHFDLARLDTGLIYRAVGAQILRDDDDPEDPAVAVAAAQALCLTDLEQDGLRREEAGLAASQVAAIPDVRAVLLAFQRDFAACPPNGKLGAVLDGRDIGTVVCPNAPHKLFLMASADVRARRSSAVAMEGLLKIARPVSLLFSHREVCWHNFSRGFHELQTGDIVRDVGRAFSVFRETHGEHANTHAKTHTERGPTPIILSLSLFGLILIVLFIVCVPARGENGCVIS